jgi:hypothetical protein
MLRLHRLTTRCPLLGLDKAFFVKNKLWAHLGVYSHAPEKYALTIIADYGYVRHQHPLTEYEVYLPKIEAVKTAHKQLESWSQEWQTEEVENNTFGHLKRTGQYKTLATQYGQLPSDIKTKVDYYAMIVKLKVYFERMSRKHKPAHIPQSIHRLFNGAEIDFRSLLRTKKNCPDAYRSIGLASPDERGENTHPFCTLMTPAGSIYGNAPTNANVVNKMLQRFDVKPIPDPHSQSMMRGLDGEPLVTFKLEDFWQNVFKDDEATRREYYNFLKQYMPFSFYRAMESIDEKPIVLD